MSQNNESFYVNSRFSNLLKTFNNNILELIFYYKTGLNHQKALLGVNDIFHSVSTLFKKNSYHLLILLIETV